MDEVQREWCISWKRFVSTQVLFNLIEFTFVYRTIKILASMEKRRCTFSHEFDPSSKIKKKKKKRKENDDEKD